MIGRSIFKIKSYIFITRARQKLIGRPILKIIQFFPVRQVCRNFSVMFYELKLFLIVLKVIGFYPIKNVFSDDGSRLKIEILTSEMLIVIFLKCLMYLIFADGISKTHFYFIAQAIVISVTFEIQVLFVLLPKAVDCIRKVENFDRGKLICISFTKSGKRRYFWLISILLELFLIVFLGLMTYSMDPAVQSLFDFRSALLMPWVITSPTIFVTRIYVAVCHELRGKFQILNKIYAEVCDLMNENEILLFCDPKLISKRIESIRLTYSRLSDAAHPFIQGSNLPVALYLVVLFLECAVHLYAILILDHTTTGFHIYRISHWCWVIFTVSYESDRLKNEVGTNRERRY